MKVMPTYFGLLRSITVGGHNIIKMTELKAFFEGLGSVDVATFIQSGNVVFRSDETDVATLMNRIERGLSARFAYASRVVVFTHPQLAHVVERAPAGFGKSPGKYRYDVIFLRPPLIEAEAIKRVSLKEGVDTAHTGPSVLYLSRLIAKATQSRLSKLVSLPVYQHMTIRNWNTTTK